MHLKSSTKFALAALMSLGVSTTVFAAETIKVGVLHSLSGTMAISETTLKEDIEDFPLLIEVMDKLRLRVERDLAAKYGERTVRSLVVKLKFSDFTQTTAERAPEAAPDQDGERQLVEAEICRDLLAEAWRRGDGKGVRLVGVGVRFADPGSRSQLQFEL